MVARNELAKPMKRCNIAACFSKIADERQRKIELTYCIKNVSSMQQIALRSVYRLWWCRTRRNLTQTKPGPRQLATICFSAGRPSGLRSDEATANTLSTGPSAKSRAVKR